MLVEGWLKIDQIFKGEHMKLFKISQTVNDDYDTYSDAVVVAPDEATAKTIHPDSMYKFFNGWPRSPHVDEDGCDIHYGNWAYIPDQVKAEYIGEAAEHLSQGAVICASYHAG